jgi:hypothetical protein
LDNETLKEIILSTLEEVNREVEKEDDNSQKKNSSECDREFLIKLRQKLLILFEGLQSPNITNLEQKLELTLNFLEYSLVLIDEKLANRDR